MADLTKIDPGQWEAAQYSGYGTRYWTVQRNNSKHWGGVEGMYTKAAKPRRFKTQAAAQRAADEANEAKKDTP